MKRRRSWRCRGSTCRRGGEGGSAVAALDPRAPLRRESRLVVLPAPAQAPPRCWRHLRALSTCRSRYNWRMPLTIAFTDVVGSSALKRDPSLGRDSEERDRAYLEQIQRPHFSLVRDAYRLYGGQEVNTMGDAFYLVFAEPLKAVRCAVEIQERLTRSPISTPHGVLQLRIGLHTGSPQLFEDGWHGTDVDIAARVEAMASARQILLSSATYELITHISDLTFHRMGEFMLKGVARLVLWEVDWDGMGPRPTTRPPVSPDVDVPPSLLGFVGRHAELSDLTSRLDRGQAVCVHGLSGIGKTSLILKLADNWLKSGRITTNGFFYFDCSQRDMRIDASDSSLLRSLASFLSQGGAAEAASIAANEREHLARRRNALLGALARGSFLLFLDNLQDALDDQRRLVSHRFSEFLRFLLSRSLGDTRFVCASYTQWSTPANVLIDSLRLEAMSKDDASVFLKTLGIADIEYADRAADLVGRHPQAIRWFSVLPRELGLTVAEVIADISEGFTSTVTEIEFQRRIEDELLRRVLETLPDGPANFLSRASVYRKPVSFEALVAVTPSPEVYAWRQVLLDRFLLEATSREGLHSQHALVREFSSSRLARDMETWSDAHRKAADWWRQQAGVLTITRREEIAARVEEHFHLVSAGYMEAANMLAKALRGPLRRAGLESFRRRIAQESEMINRALVQTSPNDPRAHSYLATSLSHQGKRRAHEAEWHFREALALDPSLASAHAAYARFLSKSGRLLGAERQFNAGIQASPGSGRLHAAYATFLSKQKRTEEALDEFQRALALAPKDAKVLRDYALFLAGEGQDKEAEEFFRASYGANATDTQMLRAYASFLEARCRIDDAAEIYEQAVECEPENPHLLQAHLKFRVRHSKPEELGAVLHDAVRRAHDKVGFLKKYVVFLETRGRYAEAEKEVRDVHAESPHNSRVTVLLAMLLARHGRQEEANAEFEALLAGNRASRRIRSLYAHFLGVADLEEGSEGARDSESDALNVSRQKIYISGRKPLAEDTYAQNYKRGRYLLDKAHDAEAAEPYLRRAAELRPRSLDAGLSHSRALEKLSRWEEALAKLEESATRNARNSEAHNARGNCLRHLSRSVEAEAAYLEAVRFGKPRWMAKYLNNLAALFLYWPDCSRLEEGIELCDRANSIDPTFRWSAETRAALEVKLRQDRGGCAGHPAQRLGRHERNPGKAVAAGSLPENETGES
jgi:class 3 adenylate cyclase/tetratricopeptide (TPR) repeat protein